MHVGIANLRRQGKRSRHSRRMCNPQFYVSGKRPIEVDDQLTAELTTYKSQHLHLSQLTAMLDDILRGFIGVSCATCALQLCIVIYTLNHSYDVMEMSLSIDVFTMDSLCMAMIAMLSTSHQLMGKSTSEWLHRWRPACVSWRNYGCQQGNPHSWYKLRMLIVLYKPYTVKPVYNDHLMGYFSNTLFRNPLSNLKFNDEYIHQPKSPFYSGTGDAVIIYMDFAPGVAMNI